jgi:hypothetical protein
MNWYKISQAETSQSKITLEMVNNPNCPPEILVEVLRMGKDDWVSRYAAKNHNCPPETLAEVLRRGNDDGVSYSAYNNDNCPIEEKWIWKNTVIDPLGFLNYVDDPPEIKNNPKIVKVVKIYLIEILNEYIRKHLFTIRDKVKIKKLIDLFSDKDFIISLYKNKIEEL